MNFPQSLRATARRLEAIIAQPGFIPPGERDFWRAYAAREIEKLVAEQRESERLRPTLSELEAEMRAARAR